MPLRHGIHHGLSFILSIGLSVVLSELFRMIFPDVISVFDRTSKIIIKTFEWNFSEKTLSVILLATLIAVVYGIVFGILEKKRDD